jgi:uncharacterized protein YbjQ (UPF0145 family)
VLSGDAALPQHHVALRWLSEWMRAATVGKMANTGAFSEFAGDISDFFGARSTEFEQKLKKARKAAITKLRLIGIERGGNAVVGIDLDYTEFSNNRIGVIANGTIVELES